MLGIPTHLAPRVNAWSTVRAFHAAAVGALVTAAIAVLLLRATTPDVHVAGAVLALVPMLAVVVLHAQIGTARSAVALLVVGGFCAWWFSLLAQRELGDVAWVPQYLESLVVAPLVLVGGAGAVPKRVVAWSFTGFVVGRVAVLAANVQTTGRPAPLILAWISLVFVIAVVVASSRTTARSQRLQPELLRAAREEHVTAYRAGVEAEAAAILHDTVLNHLNAIALSPPGPIDEHLARTVDDDVAMLTGRDWLSPETRSAPDHAVEAFDRMVGEHRAAGLDVVVTGDPAVIGKLDPRAVTAVVRAVGQCLANVAKHAGTDHAEVSVFDDGAGCTVMVVDDGRGFDEDATGADRLGLKNSVRQRIERVGGDVQLWSSPGTGTSVMMSVPYGVAPADDGSSDGVGESVEARR